MKDKVITENIKELIAIGASIGAHCQPCLEHHIQTAIELGVTKDEINQAVDIGHMVERGAMSAMKRFSSEAVKELLAAVPQENQIENQSENTLKREPVVLKIYDPAMCCTSGVCGPSVDPVLAQFAGTLNFISSQQDVCVERYNLGQEPQAFVDNAKVKKLLEDDGEKRLPFIFINDDLWIQGRYPSRDELFKALKITNNNDLFPDSALLENVQCCGKGESC
ncbi:MAG: arsenite efflux transporter metallochaperone ArsD [Desulfonatronovibrio sp.]|nr:arsenite efflux transporter metallochaperone ArsD [Desulfovibrionales bacterium]